MRDREPLAAMSGRWRTRAQLDRGVQCRRLWDFAMCTSVTAEVFRLSADLSVSKPSGFRIVPIDRWKMVPFWPLKRSAQGERSKARQRALVSGAGTWPLGERRHKRSNRRTCPSTAAKLLSLAPYCLSALSALGPSVLRDQSSIPATRHRHRSRPSSLNHEPRLSFLLQTHPFSFPFPFSPSTQHNTPNSPPSGPAGLID